MGRLSNPAEPLETLTPQGTHGHLRSRERRTKQPIHSPTGSESAVQENPGRLSNPGPRAIQRRLNTTDIARLIADYNAGQSLSNLAKKYSIHHRTVAAHLEECGVRRRMNKRKLTNDDVDEAARRYRAGESLATVGIAFNVDAATVRRELHRAEVAIRPPRGRN